MAHRVLVLLMRQLNILRLRRTIELRCTQPEQVQHQKATPQELGGVIAEATINDFNDQELQGLLFRRQPKIDERDQIVDQRLLPRFAEEEVAYGHKVKALYPQNNHQTILRTCGASWKMELPGLYERMSKRKTLEPNKKAPKKSDHNNTVETPNQGKRQKMHYPESMEWIPVLDSTTLFFYIRGGKLRASTPTEEDVGVFMSKASYLDHRGRIKSPGSNADAGTTDIRI
ncbi:MAG: hypothetical protein L6R40_004631 [Gallowayella cf. fulva]|nr:MAG: hypothetical protein L6R40_004631 [Xanthomendoza cf. fulva]